MREQKSDKDETSGDRLAELLNEDLAANIKLSSPSSFIPRC